MEHWWNDNEGGLPKYSVKNLPQDYFVYHKCPWTALGSKPGARGGGANNCLGHSSRCVASSYYVTVRWQPQIALGAASTCLKYDMTAKIVNIEFLAGQRLMKNS